MTVNDPNISRRVTELERRFRAEISQLRSSLGVATVGHGRDVRLARTAIDPSVGSYPSSGNTFWVEFLDSGFTAASGTQTPTHATRGISDGAYAHNLTGDYLAAGTVVQALHQRGLASESDGEWWLASSGVSHWQFSLNENMGATTTNQGAADLLELEDGTDTGIDIIVRDPIAAFGSLLNGDIGICVQQAGKFYILQAPCP